MEREQPLAVARDVVALVGRALTRRAGEPVAAFLLARPEHRHVARRVQIAARHPYSEIRDNLIGARMRPIDILRCKLAFFGATRFDPRSDRWLRITLFQGAPFPDELEAGRFGSLDLWRMIVSLNEIETTILKAARGAGMEWGLAEEAAQAARWLARTSLPSRRLSSPSFHRAPGGRALGIDGAWSCDRNPLAPVCARSAQGPISRTRGKAAVIVERVISPVLLLPFAARRGAALESAWGGLRRRLDASKVTADPATPWRSLPSADEKVELTPLRVLDRIIARPMFEVGGASVEEAPWARLRRYEALTYVPASAKSRLSGAGAGEIDND